MLRNQNDSAKQPAEAKRLFKGCLPGLRARNALCGGQQPYRGGRRCEVGRKVPSSHQPVPATTLLLNLNEICSRPFSPVTPGDLNLIHAPGHYLFIYLFIYVQPVHLETTHPSRTPHDFRGSWGTQPLLHGRGQKNALKLLMWCTKCPQEEPGFARCVVLEPTVPKERQNSHIFFFSQKKANPFPSLRWRRGGRACSEL